MYTNPYQPPSNAYPPPGYAQQSMPSSGVVTPMMLEHMRATRPWVRFLSVLGFIFTGLMLLGAVGIAATQSANPNPQLPGGPAIALVYVAFAVLYVLPTWFMHKYAGAIDQLLIRGAPEDMESALEHQKSFWKASGIMALVMIVLMLVAMVGGILMAMTLTR